MSDEQAPVAAAPTPEAPAAATPQAAPKTAPRSTDERIAAAMAEMATESSNPPVTEANPPVLDTNPPVTAPKGIERSFEALAKEKAALRQQAEQMKPYLQAAQAIPAETLQAVAKARAGNDPLAVLAAMGFTNQDLNKAITAVNESSKQQPTTQKEPQALGLPPEVAAKLAKLDQIEQRLAQMDQKEQQVMQQQQHSSLLESAKAALPKDLKFVSQMGREAEVLTILEEHFAATGSLPSDNFEENVQLAARELDRRIAAEAEKYRPYLTLVQPQGNVAPVAPSEPASRGQVTTGKTLTNSNTSAAQPAAQNLTTRKERIAALIADPNFNIGF